MGFFKNIKEKFKKQKSEEKNIEVETKEKKETEK